MKRFFGLTFLDGGALRVFCDTPGTDAGAGGSAAPADAAAVADAGDPSDGGAAGVDALADDTEQSDDDLILGEEDPQASGRTDAEQLAALRKSHRKLKGRYLKAKPILERTRGLNLDDLQQRARQFDAITEAARSNPRLLAALRNSDDPAERAAGARAETSSKLPSLPAEFTLETLGFDPTESTSNRVLAAAIAHIADLRKTVDELKGVQTTVQSLQRDSTARSAQEEYGQWKAGLDNLTEKLKTAMPGNALVLKLAKDAYVGAFEGRARHGKKPQQVVDHYLQELVAAKQISPKTATAVSAGVQAGMAAHNRTLPRSPAGGGTPAAAAGNARPLLKDVHRKLRGR